MTIDEVDLQKLKEFGLLRAANIAICLGAIFYFLFAFTGILKLPVSLINLAWNYFTQILIIVPHVFLLLLFLILEIRKSSSLRRHAIFLALIIATIAFGQFWATGVTAAVQHDRYYPNKAR